MRLLSFIALLLISLLGALFIYVAEDIPEFGDPHAPAIRYTRLFTLQADGLEDRLNEGMVSEKVIDAFQRRGFPVPSRVEQVAGAEDRWDLFIPKRERYYAKEEKYYHIRKENDELIFFRYAFVVRWIEKGHEETAVPNMVAFGLADYRGYDTLGEVVVIFTAGISVILVLRRRGRL